MSTTDILQKLADELHTGITTEVQVVYVLAGVRKIIERDKLEHKFARLRFYCDWALHSRMDRAAAKNILKQFDDAHILLLQSAELHDLPSPLRQEIDRISKMEYFKKEFFQFLGDYGLPPLTIRRPDGWNYFLHLYSQVVEGIPLVVSPPGPKAKIKRPQIETPPRTSLA